MKQHFLFAALLLAAATSTAQDFSGYRAGNYTGVNGVFFNPANIADSRYRFDFNLFSVSSFVGNNKASFSLKELAQSFDGDSIKKQFTGPGTGASSGLVNVDVHGPSLMFNVGNGSVAITTRARTMANAIDVDGKLVDQLIDDANNGSDFPYSVSSNNDMRVTVNGWTEFGASYARVLKTDGPHFIKGGITLKYLAGVANGYINANKLNGTLTQDVLEDVYLSNASGRIAAGFGGVNISDLEASDLTKMKSSGFGGDVGFVYEWRPGGSENLESMGRDDNKYKLKVGFALLDIGRIKYTRDQQRSGSYDVSISGSEQLNLAELEDAGIDGYNEFFKNRPQYFTPTAGSTVDKYSVSLPATLQLDVDYHLQRGFYANLATQFSLNNKNKNPYNNLYYNSVTLTPRYEGKALGVYVPLSYNGLTQFAAGLSLRAGPFFVGSGSILSAALGNSKQADVHLGLRFGGLHKNKQ